MATVYLPRKVATSAERMPRICMICGGDATQVTNITYSSQFIHMGDNDTREQSKTPSSESSTSRSIWDWFPVTPEGLGFILLAPFILLYIFTLWVASLIIRKRFRGLTTCCDEHRNQTGRIQLREVTPNHIVLEGVHENFRHAVKQLPH